MFGDTLLQTEQGLLQTEQGVGLPCNLFTSPLFRASTPPYLRAVLNCHLNWRRRWEMSAVSVFRQQRTAALIELPSTYGKIILTINTTIQHRKGRPTERAEKVQAAERNVGVIKAEW